MPGLCEGRVAIVTGGARGIGREHALMLASHGAKVVVNDLGGEMDGTGQSKGPADDVVAEIKGMGGEAVSNGDSVSDWEGAQRLINTAVESFGRLDVLINNAGILRDRMLVNMTAEEWDAVINVHLRGTFAPSRWAAAYWRDRAKAGEANDARIINTTSVSGIYGNPGQTNYGAAKMGIAAFTIIASRELGRYGVTVNAVAPGALTRMTEGLGMGQGTEEDRERMSPRWIAADRHLARERAIRGRDWARVRSVGPRPRGRRGLASRAAGRAGRRSDADGPRRRRAFGEGPCERRHGRRRQQPLSATELRQERAERCRSTPMPSEPSPNPRRRRGRRRTLCSTPWASEPASTSLRSRPRTPRACHSRCSRPSR